MGEVGGGSRVIMMRSQLATLKVSALLFAVLDSQSCQGQVLTGYQKLVAQPQNSMKSYEPSRLMEFL